MRRLLTSFIVALGFFAPMLAYAAPAPGSLIKLADSSAVYYFGGDGKRYVFPNERTYKTWYADFSGVTVVSAADMASYPVGGNVRYRAGTRLVKIASVPKVYAVEPNGVLRWIASEDVARSLYGADWNKKIDDISDAFFVNYSEGAQISSAVYPTGSLVRRVSDSALFLIQGATKRRVTTDARTALRIRDEFIVAGGDLATYADGSDVTATDVAWADPADRTVMALTPTTFSVRTPGAFIMAATTDTKLIELRAVSGTAVVLKKVTVKLEATTGAPTFGVDDVDRGGLIFENSGRANFSRIRFVDANGNEPLGRVDLDTVITSDQQQTLIFRGNVVVPANVETVLTLKADVHTDLPVSEGYRLTLIGTGFEVVEAASGAAATFFPTGDFVGGNITTIQPSFEVSGSVTPGLVTYIRGAAGVPISSFSFKATDSSTNIVEQITVQGYIDEQEGGASGFLIGGDNDNGTETRVRDVVPSVWLYSGTGTKLAGPVTVDFEGRAVFSGLQFGIEPGSNATVVVRGDISATAELELNPDRISFDIEDASRDVVVKNIAGRLASVGIRPNGGGTPPRFVTIKKYGTATFSWHGSGGSVIAGRETQLGTMTVVTKDDGFDLKALTFQLAADSPTLLSVRLEYPNAAGATTSATKEFHARIATFSGINARLAKDTTTTMNMYGQMRPREGGAVYAEQIAVTFAYANTFQMTSITSGALIDESKLGGAEFPITANTSASTEIRFSKLTIAKSPDSPTQAPHAGQSDFLKFTMKAEPEGGVRVKKMTFKITPGDAGTVGADNDALERWADLNGDFNDDDAVVELVQIVGNQRTVIGEGGTARVRYSIFHDGAYDDTPEGLDSVSGDYARVVYDFEEGSEFSIGAGGNYTLMFGLDGSQFATFSQSCAIELQTDGNFFWTDISSGAYPALNGIQASGLPISTSLSVQ